MASCNSCTSGRLVLGPSGSTLTNSPGQNFMSATEFCIRACKEAPQGPALCQHIYDVMGCGWNMPGNYNASVFENCLGDSGEVSEPTTHRSDNILFSNSRWVSMEVPLSSKGTLRLLPRILHHPLRRVNQSVPSVVSLSLVLVPNHPRQVRPLLFGGSTADYWYSSGSPASTVTSAPKPSVRHPLVAYGGLSC